MTIQRTLSGALILAVVGLLSACGDQGGTTSGGSSSPSSKTSSAPAKSAAATPPPSASAAPASNLPDKGPWDAVKITYTKDDAKDGSPYFTMENLGGKTVKVCFIDFYGYDDKGKQVAHEQLSWNGELKGGAKDDSLYTHKHAEVKTWEAVYHGIEFEGDTSPTMDYKKGPDQRPKGG